MQRLSNPMVRDRNADGSRGDLREASWDEALARAASGIQAVTDELGPTGFGMFSCSKATNELNYMAQKFARTVVGSNKIDSCNRT